MDKIKLGLKENWQQFTLLVLVNAFVGGMVGLERTILPEIAVKDFGIAAKTAILSFIIAFGLSKSISNFIMGSFANKYGRKFFLILGWLFAIPIPFLLIYAPSWNWIVWANIFLGINQGLAWSSTVVMKIDLVGEKNRGFAMGLNEFAGYLSVAIVAFLTSWLASKFGLRPYPFYLGGLFVFLGLFFTVFFIRDTVGHVGQEDKESKVPRLRNIFLDTTWRHGNLGAITQAGLVNNLNDGMVWGLFPMLLTTKGFGIEQIGIITAVYPAVWGVGQLFTGRLADLYSKKNLMIIGMLIQATALVLMPLAENIFSFVGIGLSLGLGTAMVYPTFWLP